MKKPAPWVQTTGRLSYRFRQHLQIVLLAVCLLVTRRLGSDRSELLLLAISALLVLVGGGLRSWAMGHHVWRRVKGEGSERSLVTAGPYAHTRNPLYLGSFLIGCGIASMSGWLGMLLAFVVLFAASHGCIIRWEEGRLVEEFGESFERYVREVPRFFPGLRSASKLSGSFSLRTMMRCMEPLKTLGFLLAVLLMAWFRAQGWSLVG